MLWNYNDIQKTNKEIYFLAHIDEQTDIEDKTHGLINWIRICKDKLDINDIKNSDIKIILYYGRDTDKKCKYSDIINKIIKDNILSITTVQHNNSSDNCLLLVNGLTAENLPNTFKKVNNIKNSKFVSKKYQEVLLLDKTNKIFFLPTDFIKSLTEDNVTITNSQQVNMQTLEKH